MKDKIIEYNPTSQEFHIWFAMKHRILYKIYFKKCKSDFEKGKITINEPTDDERELANMILKKEKLEKEIKQKKKKIDEATQ